MWKFLFGIMMLMQIGSLFATNNKVCASTIEGYKLVKNSLYPFVIDGQDACFFAFYTTNPDPSVDVKGNGNPGDAIWYGYYKLNNAHKIYLFPKPSSSNWGQVCTIDAVSFYDINNDGIRDVTVIGSCDKEAINYTIPFVFIREGNKYILDEDLYNRLFGFIALTINDIRTYFKSPNYYKVLKNRSKLY